MAIINNKSATITTSKTVREFINSCLSTTVYGDDIKKSANDGIFPTNSIIGDGNDQIITDTLKVSYKANKIYTYFIKINTGSESVYGYATDCYWNGKEYIINYYELDNIIVSDGSEKIIHHKPFTQWTNQSVTLQVYPFVRFDNTKFLDDTGSSTADTKIENPLYFEKTDSKGSKTKTVYYSDGYWDDSTKKIVDYNFTSAGPESIQQIIFDSSKISFEKVWTGTRITATLENRSS